MTDKILKGTPPLLFLPAKNYVFKATTESYVVKIPRKGAYHDIAPDFFPEDSGEFNIYDEEGKILYLPSITKVLFATKQYPALKFNQFFVPYSVKFEEEEVVIVGQVIDMLVATKEEEKAVEEGPVEGEPKEEI